MLTLLMLAALVIPKPAPDLEQRRWSPLTEAQAEAVQCTEPEACYSGRRFGAKSNTGCVKSFLYASLYPGAHTLLAREERASMDATTLRTLRDEVVPPALWQACWKESKSDLVLPNGSVIHVRGLDKPQRILGLRVGLAVIDQAEQIDFEQFEMVNSCVMQVGMPFHQTLLLFNPADPNHWAYQRYRPDDGDGVRANDKGDVFARVIHVKPDDLLHLLSEGSRRRFDSLTGVLGQRLREGLWVASEGLVYCPPWDPAVHVLREKPAEFLAWGGYPPPDWARYRGIDFGYLPDPFVCQWWAESPSGVRYLYRELCKTSLNPEQQAEAILEHELEEMEVLRRRAMEEKAESQYLTTLRSMNIAGSFSDHQRGERAMLAARGVATSPAQKDITAGIATMHELLDPSQPGGPRILVVPGYQVLRDPVLVDRKDPTCFVEEVAGAAYREDGARRDLPKPGKDHCLDAARYVHHSLERGSVGVWV